MPLLWLNERPQETIRNVMLSQKSRQFLPMTTTKKRGVRPQAQSLRRRFLYSDVSEEEHDQIQEYCRSNQISVSQFIADLLLTEALKPKSKRKEKVILEIELTPEEHDKLELLARLHQMESVGQFVREVLEPELRVQRLHAPIKTKQLRYYLSDEEYEIVMRYVTESGISARNYAATLALRAIRKASKKGAR
jgi:hypothetical protein